MLNAMLIDPADNVVVAIEPIAKGEQVTYLEGGTAVSFQAAEDVTIFHKVARSAIAHQGPVVKYGEHIGLAGCEIGQGYHVHTHNVESHREDLSVK